MQPCHRKVLWPRMKCTNRLLYFLVLLVGLTVGNLFGIIQFHSNQVIINLYPVPLSNKNPVPGYHDISRDEFKNDYHINYEHTQTIAVNNNFRNDQIDQESMRQNISRLFVMVSKSKVEIKAGLSQAEIVAALQLEERYKYVIEQLQRQQRIEFKEENPPKKDKDGKVVNDTDYDDLELTTKLDDENFVERSDFVKLLKLEKWKRTKKKFANVKMLLDRTDETGFLTNETELEDYWNKYFFKINELRLYNDPVVLTELLEMMATTDIVSAREKERGTQIKVLMMLENGIEVLVKPMKYVVSITFFVSFFIKFTSS